MLTLLLTVCLHAEPPKAHPLAPRGFDPRIDEAQSLRTKGLRGDALDLLGVVELEARKKKDPVSEGRALQKRGDLQLDVDDCKGSKASYEAALEVLGKADPIASGQTWNDLGIWAKRCASPQEQRVFFGNALGSRKIFQR